MIMFRSILVFLLAVGCGASAANVARPARPPVTKTTVSARTGSKPEKAPEPGRTEETERQARFGGEEPERVSEAPIPRIDLLATLEEGIPRFLQHVKVEPWFSDGRFVGWQVVSLFPNDLRFSRSSVQAGDVVIEVNGRSIERPENLKALWDGLAAANSLNFTVLRAGRIYVIEHQITE